MLWEDHKNSEILSLNDWEKVAFTQTWSVEWETGSGGRRGGDMFCVLSITHRWEEPAKISRQWEPGVESQRSNWGGIKNHSQGSYCGRCEEEKWLWEGRQAGMAREERQRPCPEVCLSLPRPRTSHRGSGLTSASLPCKPLPSLCPPPFLSFTLLPRAWWIPPKQPAFRALYLEFIQRQRWYFGHHGRPTGGDFSGSSWF